MYEFVQTERGWLLCWGGAALYAEAVAAPVIRTADSVLAAGPGGDQEAAEVLSA
jgi:hypothetical protein